MNYETRLYQALKEPEYRPPFPSGKIEEGALSPIFPEGGVSVHRLALKVSQCT